MVTYVPMRSKEGSVQMDKTECLENDFSHEDNNETIEARIEQ